ncbi:MAG: sigma-54-dependent Fis family transcriptional regulator [Planctomycetes bacterium]|nr:sigma-54-dependent Fis family transcriptional regulator [Planctomycetota bacterium]
MNHDPLEAPRAHWLPSSVRERLARAAESDATVLLTGESGSGKGSAARELHAAGPRAAGPLIEVALAALSPSLIEAELFGHEAGAFTGAAGRRRGRFERAQAGTIVLAGIECLRLETQVKLLRVLQEREVEPLGSEEPVPLDVRVVATASADLRERVRRGGFREDLYYRLAVIELALPPLRERRGEFIGIARLLTERVARRLGVPARPLDAAVLERLAKHPWPGNLRELENCLERLHVLGGAQGGSVELGELAFLDEDLVGVERELAERALALGLDLATLEGALIEAALRLERGNRSAAARRLGIGRRVLERRRHPAD